MKKSAWLRGLTASGLATGMLACGPTAPLGPDSQPGPDAKNGPDADPNRPDAPPIIDANTTPDAATVFALRMFVQPGNHYRFDISAPQADIMNQGAWGNPVPEATYTDELTITLTDGLSQTFGKLGVRTVGQSTWQAWPLKTNIRVDSNEFQPDVKVGGVEHFRFNNGRVGGLFREALALRVWDALGYPTPATNHAWVSVPSQWGEGVERPYEIIEVYKKPWCDREIDGGCVNMWESVYNFDNVLNDPSSCQLSTCDNTRIQQASSLMQTTPQGPGYAAATSSVINWDMFQSFQCLSWITGTGDDYIHNQNNLLIVERTDGRLQFHPYSSDISAGIQVWGGYYGDVHLQGVSELANGCQSDPACWADTLTKCDQLIDAFEALDPATTMVQPLIDLLGPVENGGLGMMDVDSYPDDGYIFGPNYGNTVPTDTEDAAFILNWYQTRVATVRAQRAQM